MPYHAEHHAFPQIPFHALEKVHYHIKRSTLNTPCVPPGKEGYISINKAIIEDLLNSNNTKQ